MSRQSMFPVESGGPLGFTIDGLQTNFALNFKNMVETTVDQTQLTKMHKDNRRAEREHVKQRKKLSSTAETEHIAAATMASTRAGHISDDNFDAFHNARKIPTLRNTPARIVWPQRPDGRSVGCRPSCSMMTLVQPEPSNKNKASQHESHIDEDKKPRRSRQPSEIIDINDYNKRSSRRGTTSMAYHTDEVTRSRNVSVMIHPQTPVDEDDTDYAYTPVADHDFWENTGSNIRIDSLGIGTPRPDPYHSSWGRDARRCYFLSPLSKPPHIREPFFRAMKKIPNKMNPPYTTPYASPYTTNVKSSIKPMDQKIDNSIPSTDGEQHDVNLR